MSRYEGRRTPAGPIVTVDGHLLDPRLDLRNHSPTGFEWGYAGSGSAQLALALLADHMRDDPTIRRCIGFARDWGFGRLVVVNLFALRSTSPRALRRAPDPVGPRNDRWIARLAADAELVIAAWGALGNYRDRARLVTSTLSDLYCLGRTRDGSPRHPLYVRRDAARQRSDGCA